MYKSTQAVLEDLSKILIEQEAPVAQPQAGGATPAQSAPDQTAPPQPHAAAAQQAVAQLPPPVPRPRSSFLLIHQWLEQQESTLKKIVGELASTAESGNLVRQEYEELGRVVAALRSLSSSLDQTKGFVAVASRRLDPTTPNM